LNYALKNRQNGRTRGLEVVAGLLEDAQAKLLYGECRSKAAPMLEIKVI
jgi:hypothetical protein